MHHEHDVCVQMDLEGFALYRRGKVRDVYEVGENLLLIATDRISAFDVVMPTPIPMKGTVLTQLSRFWFGRTEKIVRNHLITADVEKYPPELKPYLDPLRLRSMLAKRAEIFPIECVARGYLSGSGWKEYADSGEVCGIRLPEGLRESGRLPEPIFTPATKEASGHDINIPFERAAEIVGQETAEALRRLTLEIYCRASEYALEKGIIIADAKFEFGLCEGEITLCDEVLTPDASRFWPLEGYRPGRAQPSYDKQFVRDYLEQIRFNKQPPGPELPETVVRATTEKYMEAYRRLTESRFD